jgi:hypothetical protein
MRAKSVLALVPALVLLAGCEFDDVGEFGRYHEDFHYAYSLKTGGRLSVESFNGSIEVSPWDQENVDISGTKFARTQDEAADIRIDIDHTNEAVSIRARRPFSRYGNQGARFAIKVPRSVVLERLITSNGSIRATDGVGPARLKSSNGGIHVLNFHGDLDMETSNSVLELTNVEGAITGHTSNGGIRGEGLRGSLDVGTSNSSIRVRLERAEGTVKLGTSNGPIDLTLPAGPTPAVRAHTSNSGITLHMPNETNAQIEASTSNGSITSDFDMRLHGEFGKHHLSGALGNGGPLIDLSTSNGSIRIVH